MMKFKELSDLDVASREKEISEYWKEINLLKQSTETRKDGPSYVFYDGPPTANGKPGIHHVISRTLKDMTVRYKTMRGYYVERKAGWDTHGLPVEIEAEKKLKLNSKKEIEEYGVEKFNKVCRDSVFTYSGLWREMSDRMAFLADMDNPYITLDNNYIETVWHLLDDFNKKGLLYRGAKILPYCPRCGTGLASHEVAQGYKEIKSQTAVAKFKLKDKENEYFLAWTTTPWTLPSNVALTVGPDIDYVKVKQDDNYYYVAKALATKVLGEDYEIVEEMKGKDLEYIEYEQLLPFLEVDKKAFFVTLADYVSIEDGTGIVHSAPAFGEDDYQTGRRYDLPMLNPVDEEGKFTATPWKGTFVMDADLDIIIHLGKEEKIYAKQKMEHNYPHCWRCGTPLIYYSKPSWYLEVTKVQDQMIKNNKGVNWFPAHTGEKRFGNWLENLKDWAISRERYWGTPLPIWMDSKGNFKTIGSREELARLAIEDVDPQTIDLHRPFVDDIHIKNEDNGEIMTRVPEVLDVWFDSGAMPFAQNHYPFEHEDNFEKLFPADFISEGIDQTRGWFYTLMAISTMYKGVAPYKNVLVNDLVLDKDGKKMSKSRGNTLDPFEMFDKHGADAIRFYSIYVSPAWVPTKFDEDGVREVETKLFRTYRNIYSFFQLYANTDNVDPTTFFVDYKDRPEIDRWLISKFNSLVKYYDEQMEIFEYTQVSKKILEFLVEDFSNWYIRRNRRRFWKSEINDDKKSVYNTTYEVLVGITKLLAPMIPFTTEEMYQKLVGNTSVHLEELPKLDESLIDKKLEEKMDLARQIVTLGRSSREDAGIKVRQPLSEILLDKKHEEIISDLSYLIKEELNVKEVVFSDDISKFMNYELKPNFKVAGSILGKKIGALAKELKSIDAKAFVEKLENGPVTMNLNGEDTEIIKDYIEIRISSKEGFDVSMDKNVFVILDTELNEDLLQEGYMREFVSKVQQMRKSNGYEVMDEIEIYFESDDELFNALSKFETEIKKETLAQKFERKELDTEELELNDKSVKIELKRI
ncbi:isoleucine--tRNA ligase [Helcococcus kunzii]|uniref:isoleucine--tRNA ligase n=1 Tax=Helcococcus kunzii TaxID=40091 RepID=UPI0024ADBF59|nr:isoleucine--tRNA ligase [Helcococcus kunzii]